MFIMYLHDIVKHIMQAALCFKKTINQRSRLTSGYLVWALTPSSHGDR
jgi:hypothetical protein